MSAHASFIGKKVRIKISNGADRPAGQIVCQAVGETADSLVIHASKGGVMQNVTLEDARILEITEEKE